MFSFSQFLTEEKAKPEDFGSLANDPKGKLHEVLVGYHLLGGKHMKKHASAEGLSPKEQHDTVAAQLEPHQYKNFKARSKKSADAIMKELNLKQEDIANVQWTSKEGDIHRATGVHSSQKEDDSDLVITDKSGKHHGVSLKVSDKSEPITLSNPGIESTYGGDKILKAHREQLKEKFPILNKLTNKAQRKEWLKSHTNIEKQVKEANAKVLTDIAKHTHESLSGMTPEQRAHHARHIVLHAYSTPMQAAGHNHIRNFIGGGHDPINEIHHPDKDHEHILNDPENITTKHSGTSVYFHHKGVPFAMQTIKFSSQSDPLGSVVGSGKEVIRKGDLPAREAEKKAYWSKKEAEQAPVAPTENVTSKHIEQNHPMLKRKLSEFRPSVPAQERRVPQTGSPFQAMAKPGIKPGTNYREHTDGTHGGLKF